MAGEFPGPHRASRRPSAWPRGWLTFEQYQEVHYRCMEDLYREGLVDHDDLRFTETVGAGGEALKIRLSGQIECARGVSVRVLKWMDVRRDARARLEVISRYYQYHAWRPARGRRREQALVRYDQAHGGLHRHVFDTAGHEVRSEPMDLDSIPRLDAFIREAVEIASEIDATG